MNMPLTGCRRPHPTPAELVVTRSLTTPLRADARPSFRYDRPRPTPARRMIFSEDGSLRRAMRLRRGFLAIGALLGSPLSDELVHALVALVINGTAPVDRDAAGGCEAHAGIS